MRFPDLYKKKRYELLTSGEVCSLLRISQDTLYRIIKKGDLPMVKVGGTYRFKVGEVITYITTVHRVYPLCFKLGVMDKYRQNPDQYHIRPIKSGGGLLEIIEIHQKSMGTHTYQGLIHFHERQWLGDEKVIVITQPQFKRLPLEEQIHFRRFQIP